MNKRFLHVIDVVILLSFTTYVLLDTFLIPHAYGEVVSAEEIETEEETEEIEIKEVEDEVEEEIEIISTATEYKDENISIQIEEYRYNDTDIYVADIQVSSIDHLLTAFAEDTYGKNITAKTSEIAESNDAILAINGDFYGSQESGYVLRNGVIYRDNARRNREDLVIDDSGDFYIINEDEVSLDSIDDAYQVFSFGPALINDYEIQVDEDDEVGKAMASNPRTAICQVEENHYLFVVSDGRTDSSLGLSLKELAEFLQTLDVKVAYNLDGGGSSTMYFNGEIINNPTTSGNRVKERSVSDVIYIR